jgi:anti-anti-sigma regulatory factor
MSGTIELYMEGEFGRALVTPHACPPLRETLQVVQTEADMTCCEHIRQLFIQSRRTIRGGAKRLMIDLRHVEQADTKLIACLVVVYQIARSWSAQLELRSSPAVRRIAEICRLEGWLTGLESRR